MSTKTMKKGHGVAAAVALIAAVFTLSVNAAEWFTETAATFNAEGHGVWTASAGKLADIVQVGTTSLAIDTDDAELKYTPATPASGDVQTVTLKVCFSAAYDDLTSLDEPEGGFGLVAYDNGEKTVYAVYDGEGWKKTPVEVTNVETDTHTITITTDGKYVTYKDGDAEIAKIESTIKPSSFSFKGTGVLHDDFTGVYEINAVPLVPPTLTNATVSPNEGSYKPGETVEFTFTADAGYLFANGEKTLTLTGTIGEDGKVTFTTEPETPTASVAKIGDKEYLTLAAAVNGAAANDTITLLDDLAQSETIELTDKVLTFDLNAKTITFNGCTGFYFNGVDGNVKNGTVVVNAGDTAGLSAIYYEDAAGTVSDVTVNAGTAKFGVVTCADGVEFVDETLACENVSVTGSGALFYCESEKMTLTNCSATQTGTSAAGEVYSAALAGGWLGQLTVYSGDYAGEKNVVSTMSSPAKIALEGGTFTGAITVTPIAESYKEMGEHEITKADAVELAAPAGYVWDENGKLVAIALPTATVAGITAEGYEAAVQFDAGNIGVGYDKWEAKFVLTSNVAIGDGEIKLGGSYAAWKDGEWIDLDFPACEKDAEIDVLALGNIDNVTVGDVFNAIKSFKCGVKNIALKNDATFTLKLVITDGEVTKDICSIDNLVVAAADIVPTAEVSKIEDVDHEAAVQFTADKIGVGYNDWNAKFILVSDVAIGEGEIQLGGQYDAFGKQWVDVDFAGCTAGAAIDVLEAVGIKDPITVATMFEAIQSFKCGVKNIALKNDATFTLKLVITDGEVTKDICSIDNLKVEKKQAAYPEEWPEADEAVKAKYATWAATKGAGADLSTDAAQTAFLLNVAVDDIKDLKIESIDVDADGYVVVKVGAPGEYYFGGIDLKDINGILYIEAGDTLETMEPKSIAYWTTLNGKAIIKVKENFVRVAVGFKNPEKVANAVMPEQAEQE